MNNPVAVLISDIHFSLPTLELASAALLKAQFKAVVLKVPLIIAGDLMDTKANMRAEVVNKLIQMFSVHDAPDTIVIVGNHDLCNERGEEHSLNFLKPWATIVETVQTSSISGFELTLCPYFSDVNKLKAIISDEEYPPAKTIIMHQGLTETNSGEYIQDKSALHKEDLSGFRVISGHYHTRQHISLAAGGSFDYIGNPFSLSFSEASDPVKGFQILMSDGSLEFVPTNLRKHVKVETYYIGNHNLLLAQYGPEDLIWLKIHGPRDVLANFDTSKLIRACRVEFVYEESNPVKPQTIQVSDTDQLDRIIDGRPEVSAEGRERVKKMWKEFE